MSLMKLSQTSEPETQEELEDQIAYSCTLLNSISSKEVTPINGSYFWRQDPNRLFVWKFGDKTSINSATRPQPVVVFISALSVVSSCLVTCGVDLSVQICCGTSMAVCVIKQTHTQTKQSCGEYIHKESNQSI